MSDEYAAFAFSPLYDGVSVDQHYNFDGNRDFRVIILKYPIIGRSGKIYMLY